LDLVLRDSFDDLFLDLLLDTDRDFFLCRDVDRFLSLDLALFRSDDRLLALLDVPLERDLLFSLDLDLFLSFDLDLYRLFSLDLDRLLDLDLDFFIFISGDFDLQLLLWSRDSFERDLLFFSLCFDTFLSPEIPRVLEVLRSTSVATISEDFFTFLAYESLELAELSRFLLTCFRLDFIFPLVSGLEDLLVSESELELELLPAVAWEGDVLGVNTVSFCSLLLPSNQTFSLLLYAAVSSSQKSRIFD